MTTGKVNDHGTRRWMVLTAIVAAVVATAVMAAWWAVGSLGQRASKLDELMPNFTNDAAISPAEVTDQVCARERCVSAWDTRVGTYLEFSTDEQAEYRHQVLGADSRINGAVVLDFSAVDLDREGTERAVQLLFPDNEWP